MRLIPRLFPRSFQNIGLDNPASFRRSAADEEGCRISLRSCTRRNLVCSISALSVGTIGGYEIELTENILERGGTDCCCGERHPRFRAGPAGLRQARSVDDV